MMKVGLHMKNLLNSVKSVLMKKPDAIIEGSHLYFNYSDTFYEMVYSLSEYDDW